MFDDLLGQLERLRGALSDPSKPVKPVGPLMKQIGILGLASSQKAFADQQFGDFKWPPRYPNQGQPKFNIAGALQDFKGGRTAPKPNRFVDRPANIDEGMRGGVFGSLTYRVTGKGVIWGSQKPYAARINSGGVSIITYGEDTKERMKTWLYQKSSPRPQRGKVVQEKFKKGRSEYAKYLRPLFWKTELTTTVAARPFVGIHAQLEQDINRTIVSYFTGAQK